MHIRIGSSNWLTDLRNATRGLGDKFWARFTPVSMEDLDKLEKQIGRTLPDEFKEFYHTVGYGSFEPGDSFAAPDEIVACIGAPIYFVRGSLMVGEEWVTEDQHKQLWLTRGVDNPAPEMFTEDALTLESVKLYDLLQFGANGSGCYHQLYVGPDPAPFSYCLLTDSGTIENKYSSFSEALEDMLKYHLGELE